jgi:hypothetical protein
VGRSISAMTCQESLDVEEVCLSWGMAVGRARRRDGTQVYHRNDRAWGMKGTST